MKNKILSTTFFLSALAFTVSAHGAPKAKHLDSRSAYVEFTILVTPQAAPSGTESFRLVTQDNQWIEMGCSMKSKDPFQNTWLRFSDLLGTKTIDTNPPSPVSESPVTDNGLTGAEIDEGSLADRMISLPANELKGTMDFYCTNFKKRDGDKLDFYSAVMSKAGQQVKLRVGFQVTKAKNGKQITQTMSLLKFELADKDAEPEDQAFAQYNTGWGYRFVSTEIGVLPPKKRK
jgi:hypothetical protein